MVKYCLPRNCNCIVFLNPAFEPWQPKGTNIPREIDFSHFMLGLPQRCWESNGMMEEAGPRDAPWTIDILSCLWGLTLALLPVFHLTETSVSPFRIPVKFKHLLKLMTFLLGCQTRPFLICWFLALTSMFWGSTQNMAGMGMYFRNGHNFSTCVFFLFHFTLKYNL